MGKASRKKYNAKRSLKRRERYAFEQGFVRGVSEAKRLFKVVNGTPSMTIAKQWASVKHAAGAGSRESFEEFISTKASRSAALRAFKDACKPGQLVELRASAGDAKAARRAERAARKLHLGVPAKAYKPGDVVARLRVHDAGIVQRDTRSIDTPLAKRLRRKFPVTLLFKLDQWHAPGDAPPATTSRVPFALSSFGLSVEEED